MPCRIFPVHTFCSAPGASVCGRRCPALVHPPLDRGVADNLLDDFLWLPLAVCRYISVTGDEGCSGETVSYIESRKLNPGEESFTIFPMHSRARDTLYQHCVHAFEHGMRRGEHGLP